MYEPAILALRRLAHQHVLASRETDDDMVALEGLNIAAALGLTEQIPKAVYARACKTGSYPGRLAEDYPDP